MALTFPRLFGAARQILPIAAALAVVLVTGLVHGLWTSRWSDNHDLEEAAARVRRAPLRIAGWKGQAQQQLDSESLARAEAAGHLRRLYVNDRGQPVSVVLLCGRFGPLSVHTPDVCYSGAGYQILGAPVRRKVTLRGGGTAEVWTARFHKPSTPATPPLRICWTWSAGAGWQAPSNPRWAFRMRPLLYKLYVAREMTYPGEPSESDPCLAFLAAWLPRLDEVLFSETPVKGVAQR